MIKRKDALLHKMYIYSLIFSRVPTKYSTHTHTHRKDRAEECGAVTSVVFLEGRQFVFSVGECAGQAESQ